MKNEEFRMKNIGFYLILHFTFFILNSSFYEWFGNKEYR